MGERVMNNQKNVKSYYVCPKCAHYELIGRNVIKRKCKYCSTKLVTTEISEHDANESESDVILKVMNYIEKNVITGSQYDMMSNFMRTTKNLNNSINEITSEIGSINAEVLKSQTEKTEMLTDYSAKLATCPKCGYVVIAVDTQNETGKMNHCSNCDNEWK